jgi:hypothetical protein
MLLEPRRSTLDPLKSCCVWELWQKLVILLVSRHEADWTEVGVGLLAHVEVVELVRDLTFLGFGLGAHPASLQQGIGIPRLGPPWLVYNC